MSTPRRIAITGVSRGLGLSLARGFAREGHVVLGCARSTEVIAQLAGELPAPHDFQVVDVAVDEQVETWVSHLLELGPVPDLVISNAGVIHPNAALWDLPDREVTRVLDVNFRGVVNVARHLVPALISAGRGMLVNFSSGWGRSTSPEVSVYCASKWAVEGLTSALADELPRGVGALAVNPGVIDTEMLRSCFGEAAGHHRDPEEWARTAVPYLLGLDPSDSGSQGTIH